MRPTVILALASIMAVGHALRDTTDPSYSGYYSGDHSGDYYGEYSGDHSNDYSGYYSGDSGDGGNSGHSCESVAARMTPTIECGKLPTDLRGYRDGVN